MYFKYKTLLNTELIYIIQEELTMQWQLIRLFMRKTVKTSASCNFYGEVIRENGVTPALHGKYTSKEALLRCLFSNILN